MRNHTRDWAALTVRTGYALRRRRLTGARVLVVRTAPSSILLLLVCLGGCSSLNKKNNPGPPASPGSDVPPAAFPTSNDPILSGATAQRAGQAVIAGRVLDEYGRPAGNSHIRLVAMA